MNKMGDIISKTPNLESKDKKQTRKTFFREEEKVSKKSLTGLIKTKTGLSKVSMSFSKTRGWILAALVFLLPLWFLPWGTDKIGLAKQLLMTVLVGIGFIIWLYESMSKGKVTYRKSVINIGIWFLLLIITISAAFSLNSVKSIYSSSANFVNLWNFILLGIFYLLVVNDRKNSRKVKLIDIFLFSSGIVVFYSLLKIFGLNIFGGFTKTVGFNLMGAMSSITILAGLVFILGLGRLMLENLKETKKLKWYKWALIGTTLMSFVFIFLVNTRIVWYGLILAAIVLIVAKIKREKDVQVKSFSLPIAILVISLVFILWGTFGARIGIEQPQVTLKNLPTEVYPPFEMSFEIANKTLNQKNNLGQAFFGVGPGNFDKMWFLYRPLNLSQTDFWQLRFSQSYSSFTTWMTEVGYVGIISIVSLFIIILLQGIKRKKSFSNEIETVCLTTSVAYLILMWFLCSFNLTLYFALFLLVALLVRNNPKKEIDFTSPIQKALILSIVSVLTMIAMLFAGYFIVQRYIASVNFSKGITQTTIDPEGLEQEQIITKAQEELNKKIKILADAYNLDKSNDQALRNISQLYLNKINLALQSEDQGAQSENIEKYIKKMYEASSKAISVDKAEYQNQLNLAQLYENLITLTGDAYVPAINSYEEALKLNPGDPSIIFSIARTKFSEAVRLASIIESIEDETEREKTIEAQGKLLAQAIEDLNKAITLRINYTPAHQLLAQIYDAQGKIDEALISTSNLVILNPQDASLWLGLGLLHYKNDDMPKAELSFSEAVRLNEDYSNARYFLGLTYARQDKKNEAITQFEKVVELNPENGEVKAVLKAIKSGEDIFQQAPAEGQGNIGM